MRWRLRYQLLVPLALLLLGIAGISTWIALSSVQRVEQRFETNLRNVGQTLTEPPPFPLNPRVLQDLKRLSGAEFLLVGPEDQRESTLGDFDSAALSSSPVWNEWRELQLGPAVQLGSGSYFCSGVRLHRRRKWETVYVLYPVSAYRDAVWDAVRPTLVLGGFLGLAAILLMVEVGRRLTRRIQQVERRSRRIAEGDFSPMPLPRTKDELRDLTQSINEMAQRLAKLQALTERTERLRVLGQVSGGLAHQLRNGLAGARLALQVYCHESGVTPSPESGLEVALRQLVLLEAQLKRFLDLGKEPSHVHVECAIDELVEETISLLRARCAHAGIELTWELGARPLTLQGDADQLRQLLLNVVSNAVDAAEPGGWARVAARSEGAQIVIEVTDSGVGPPTDVAEKLFEPFVTGRAEGVGLGLTVARQVAEAHGGSIAWSRVDGHTCFRIVLAARAAPIERND